VTPRASLLCPSYLCVFVVNFVLESHHEQDHHLWRDHAAADAPGFNRITETRTFEALYAGGEANVAASLACYNQQTEFVSRVPANDLGDACIAYLRQHGIGTSHILRGATAWVSTSWRRALPNAPARLSTNRAGSSFAAIKPGMVDWKMVFQGADWFHWTGITPAVSEGAALACAEAIAFARQMGSPSPAI